MNNNIVHYILDRDFFEKLLEEHGYKNHLDFCQKNGIHRNTLNYYLSGQDVFSKKIYEIAKALNVNAKDLIVPAEIEIKDVEEIKGIVNELSSVPGLAIMLLGSRAKGSAKKYSDWDLGITRGDKPLTAREYLRLRGIVGELAENLPRKVDVVNLDSAPLWFLESIDYDPLFLGGNKNSYNFFKGVLNGIRKGEIKKVS